MTGGSLSYLYDFHSFKGKVNELDNIQQGLMNNDEFLSIEKLASHEWMIRTNLALLGRMLKSHVLDP